MEFIIRVSIETEDSYKDNNHSPLSCMIQQALPVILEAYLKKVQSREPEPETEKEPLPE